VQPILWPRNQQQCFAGNRFQKPEKGEKKLSGFVPQNINTTTPTRPMQPKQLLFWEIQRALSVKSGICQLLNL
jgi:hypothetical protein